MQKNLTIILADVVAQSVITIVRGVFPVRLSTVFFFQPIPVRVRRWYLRYHTACIVVTGMAFLLASQFPGHNVLSRCIFHF